MSNPLQLFGNMAQRFPRDKTDKSRDDETGEQPSTQKKQPKRCLELLLPFRWPDGTESIKWCVTADNVPEAQGAIGALGELDEEYRQLPLHAYVNANDVSLLQVSLPNASRKTLIKAIPYALEDRLVGDVEQQFFTWKKDHDDINSVCVIAHERIRNIIDTLEAEGLQASSLIPSVFSAPLLENSWTLVLNNNGSWIRTDKQTGLACSPTGDKPPYELTQLLDQARKQETTPTGLLLIDSTSSINAERWSSDLGLEIFLPDGGFWENLDRTDAPINLLQGQYTSKVAYESSPRKLLLSTILASVLVAGNLGLFAWHWTGLYRETTRLKSEMTRIFKETFPEQASAVIDPPAQMQSNLARLRQSLGGASPDDFLLLLSTASTVLAKEKIGNLSQVQYRNRELVLSVQAPNYQELDKLVKALGNQALRVEVSEASSDAQGVKASIRIGYLNGAANG